MYAKGLSLRGVCPGHDEHDVSRTARQQNGESVPGLAELEQCSSRDATGRFPSARTDAAVSGALSAPIGDHPATDCAKQRKWTPCRRR